MKHFTIALVGLFAASTVSLHAEEDKVIKFTELPAIVQQSVLLHTKRANIKKVELIHAEGVIKYEIETINKTANMDITFARNGEMLELEKAIPASSLPADALAAIRKDYPGINIQELETVQSFYYDVEGAVGGQPVHFKVLATGDIEDEPNEND